MVTSIEKSINHFVDYFKEAFEMYKNIDVEDIKNKFSSNKEIIICGMGGSGIAGMIVERLFEDKNIIGMTTDEIPSKYKDANFILVSYSGNTHEVLNAFDKYKNNVVCAITTGGKLKEKCENNGIKAFELPSGFIPRSTLPHMIVLLSYILNRLGVISESDIEKIREAINELEVVKDMLLNNAKEIAKNINHDDILVFLTSYTLYPAAYRTKTQINETCKMHSYAEFFSEHNHNSIMAIKQHVKNVFYVIYKDPFDNQLKKRFEFFINKLRGFRYRYVDIEIEAKSREMAMLSYILYGDYLSVEIAKRFNIDMETGDIIKELKEFLNG